MKYIVSEEHRFVYFVTQKVACTSVKVALAPLFGIDPSGMDRPRRARRGPRFEIHEVFRRSGHQIGQDDLLRRMDAGELDGYFKFAFVRNPFDRLVSCYLDKIRGRGRGLGEGAYPDIEKGMPFAGFVEAVSRIPDGRANSHFRSQHVSLFDPRSGKPLTDFVGRFEDLPRDFSRVALRIGSGTSIPHAHRSAGSGARSYRDMYGEKTRELAHERYRADLEAFGYRF